MTIKGEHFVHQTTLFSTIDFPLLLQPTICLTQPKIVGSVGAQLTLTMSNGLILAQGGPDRKFK